MDKKKQFAISVFSLGANEHRLLKTICALSAGRGRPYEFIWAPEPVILPTIWIVDAEALPAWQAKHASDGAVAVTVSSPGDCSDSDLCITRPVAASKMLAKLDTVAAQLVHQLSGLVIGGTSGSEQAGATVLSGESRAHSHYTALVVDDSPTIQKQIELGLRLQNIGAVCVDTGEAALEALENHRVDLIFLDIVLPGGSDGYEICKKIKRSKKNKNIPVVMLTSKSSVFDRVRGSMVGCDTYLTKPVDNKTFNSVVAKYLPEVQKEMNHTDRPLLT